MNDFKVSSNLVNDGSFPLHFRDYVLDRWKRKSSLLENNALKFLFIYYGFSFYPIPAFLKINMKMKFVII